MPFGNSEVEFQRDSILQPRVARHELPWETVSLPHNPNGVATDCWRIDATPLGLKTISAKTQGSSCLATLGFMTQSPWDCKTAGLSGVSSVRWRLLNSRKALGLGAIIRNTRLHAIFQGLRYSRDINFVAASSWRMCSRFTSHLSLRPTSIEISARWPGIAE